MSTSKTFSSHVLPIRDVADILVERSKTTGVPIHQLIHFCAEEFNCSASDLGRELSHRSLSKKHRERDEALRELLQARLLADARKRQEDLRREFEELGHEDDL